MTSKLHFWVVVCFFVVVFFFFDFLNPYHQYTPLFLRKTYHATAWSISKQWIVKLQKCGLARKIAPVSWKSRPAFNLGQAQLSQALGW